MPDSMDNNNKHPLQFDTADYSAYDQCSICKQPIIGETLRLNGQIVCRACRDQATGATDSNAPVAYQPASYRPAVAYGGTNAGYDKQPQSHGSYFRALIFGLGAALVGLAIYAGITILTGWFIGYVAFLVGWIIAKSMMAGSRGTGGRRYQVTAVLLTYFAISMAAVPISVAQIIKIRQDVMKSRNEVMQRQQQHASMASPSSVNSDGTPAASPDTESSAAPATESSSDSSSEPATETAPRPAPHRSSMPFAAGIATIGVALIIGLIIAGLASPFLFLIASPLQGAIGLFILFIGMRIAWRITAGTVGEQSYD